MSLKGIVRNGRIVIDEPVNLPEGTVLALVLDDEGDSLDEAERELLHREIDASCEELERGEGKLADDVLGELRAKRS